MCLLVIIFSIRVIIQMPDHNALKPKNRPAIGKPLRKLYFCVLALCVLIVANSIYLAGVTFLEWFRSEILQNYFYQVMFLFHILIGLILLVPVGLFIGYHWSNTRNRKNRRAVRVGYALTGIVLLLFVSGLLLVRVSGIFELKHPLSRSAIYWLHVGTPLIIVWLYWMHRLVGPKLRWNHGARFSIATLALVAGMVALHFQDPRTWQVAKPESGTKYFEPSLARTASGNFIPAKTLMNDQYCKECHADAHKGWEKSAHHFSSFNNPAYLVSIRETRHIAFERDQSVQASRWCAGCHDPVPFFSGAFDDPQFDDVNHETSQAGITCTTCHAITDVPSVRGNADFVIDEPVHYPFAFSENELLKWVNKQLVKAKPEFHKKTFLKPLHQSTEFCSTCHKVSLPFELTKYKEFLRGQNHYDSFFQSGISGHNIRSFYYPPIADHNCNRCHMPLKTSNDFAAALFDDSNQLKIHDHLFVGANTGLAWLKKNPEIIQAHKEFMKKDVIRLDLFGIREGTSVDANLIAPLRPTVPELEPGNSYLIEMVIRTLRELGHHFTQGTTDSNEIWIEIIVKSGDRIIGHSGGMDEKRQVDPWSHFVNTFMLDRNGNRIDRRNAQDIFTPLYSHQIAPGTAQSVHYRIDVPEDLVQPIEVIARLHYRKFDSTYMDIIARSLKPEDAPLRGYEPGQEYLNPLPIITLAEDRIMLPVAGQEDSISQQESTIPPWQRWNDYGIGLLLKGKVELRQAAQAFENVEASGRYDGPLNLARVYFTEGRLDEAVAAVARASKAIDPKAPKWTLAWMSGIVNRQQGYFVEAISNLESALYDRTPDMIERGFDFSQDYSVINELAQTYFDVAKRNRGEERRPVREEFLKKSRDEFKKVLLLDPENVTAHYGLQQVYAQLGDLKRSEEHMKLHTTFKPDDNAKDRAIAAARTKYPAANHASEPVVIYDLQREEAKSYTESPSAE